MTPPNLFRQVKDLGYDVIPIVPPQVELSPHSSLYARLHHPTNPRDDRGKSPGERKPDGTWKGTDWLKLEGTPEELDLWASWGASLGIRAGGAHNIVALDSDTLNAEWAEIVHERVLHHFGQVPTRIGNAPKTLYLVRTNEPVPYMALPFGPVVEIDGKKKKPNRVELLTQGKQFVAYGLHPKTGRDYEWTVPLEPAENLVEVDLALLKALFEDLAERLPEPGGVTQDSSLSSSKPPPQETLRAKNVEVFKRAVKSIPNDYDDRSQMVRIGAGIRAALWDEDDQGFEVWRDWAGQWPGNTDKTILSDWNGFKPPFKVGADEILDEAYKRTGTPFAAEQWCFPIDPSDPSGPLTSAGATTTRTPSLWDIQAVVPPRRKLRREKFKDVAADQAQEVPIIDGLMDEGKLSVIFGRSGAGKSFVSMDMAWHIAAGRDWAGMETTQGAVLYVAAEGGPGVGKRIRALELRDPTDVPLEFIRCPVDLFDPEADLQQIIDEIEAFNQELKDAGRPYRVTTVFLDTLARVMVGGDESKTTDISVLTHHCAVIQARTGAHVCLIHHTGHTNQERGRGSSALPAALDTELRVADGEITSTKLRDAPPDWCQPFELVPVVTGQRTTKKGTVKDITSCTVKLIPLAMRKVVVGVPTHSEQSVLDALTALEGLKVAGEAPGVKAADLSKYLNENPATTRKFLDRLSKKNLVKRETKGLWILGERDKGIFDPNSEERDTGETTGHDVFS